MTIQNAGTQVDARNKSDFVANKRFQCEEMHCTKMKELLLNERMFGGGGQRLSSERSIDVRRRACCTPRRLLRRLLRGHVLLVPSVKTCSITGIPWRMRRILL